MFYLVFFGVANFLRNSHCDACLLVYRIPAVRSRIDLGKQSPLLFIKISLWIMTESRGMPFFPSCVGG